MKLATFRDGSRDGRLLVVSSDMSRALPAEEVAPTLQIALDCWEDAEPRLRRLAELIEQDRSLGTPFEPAKVAAPLPRAFQFLDAGCYLNHMELVRAARNAPLPPKFLDEPAMYQGLSDSLAAAHDPIVGEDEWGIDLEAEVAAVTGDVPIGATFEEAIASVRLIMFMNDVSLRNLIPDELQKGFGFLQSKPTTAFSPVAVTPDELGEAWSGGKLRATMQVEVNGEWLGNPVAGVDMQFDFGTVIAYAAKSRALTAGTIVGTGTVSNRDRARGVACLVEKRCIETLESGKATTAYLRQGDRVTIELIGEDGASLMGRIDQTVEGLGPANRRPPLL